MDVHVAVDGQRMTFIDSGYRFAPQSQKFIKFVFDLSDDWNDLTIFAQFKQGNNAYNSYLDSSNCVYLPNEIAAGDCCMMLYGTGNGAVIGTTNGIRLCISDNGYVEDAQSTEITESLYQQLIERLNDYITVDWIASVSEVEQALGLED